MVRISLIPALLVASTLVAQTPTQAGPRRLSLQEAIQSSLENNLQVQVARETREQTKASVLINLGTYDWMLTGNLNLRKTEGTITRQFEPGGPYLKADTTTDSRNLTLGTNKAFGWGANLAISYTPSFSSTSASYSGISTTEPTPYIGSLNATYTQSLLKGFGRQVAESNLIVARKGAMVADLTFQKSIIDLVASTESLYWDVVFTQENLANKQQALSLAQKQLKENRIRVEVGTLAPIEVTSAEASVALKEQEIIAAESQLQNAKDALLRALYPTTERPSALELTDAPKVAHVALEESAAEKLALERRVELKSARIDVESKHVLENVANNRLKPQLDLSVGYTGNAANHESFSSVNSDITGAKFPGYSVGLVFSMPIANRTAKGNVAQAKASRRTSELNLRDLELGIVLETRQALRNLQTAEKTVAASEKTRVFREKNLEAEQKKFENGMSTNFFVLQRQDELDQSKAQELQARINYAKAATALEKANGNLLEARGLQLR